MNEMENKLKKYYEEVGIASVGEMKNENGNYDYEEMFDSFCCCKKDDCREVCRNAYKPSDEDKEFLFSPRTQGVEVSEYYAKKKYKGHSIPRIVVVSLSVPKPEQICSTAKKKTSSRKLNQHWRGTTTTVRSLLDPFVDLAPAGDRGDNSTEIIEKLFVHVRTGKCSSNVGGKNQEPAQLYKNCGDYLSEEVRILEPDVVVTQGGAAHLQAEEHVFVENTKNTPVEKIEGIANSIARIVRLKKGNRRVYWLSSHFPYAGFYSDHAGKPVASEIHIVGAKREKLVLYGRDIKKFMDAEGR